jgi:hypothetical protein
MSALAWVGAVLIIASAVLSETMPTKKESSETMPAKKER